MPKLRYGSTQWSRLIVAMADRYFSRLRLTSPSPDANVFIQTAHRRCLPALRWTRGLSNNVLVKSLPVALSGVEPCLIGKEFSRGLVFELLADGQPVFDGVPVGLSTGAGRSSSALTNRLPGVLVTMKNHSRYADGLGDVSQVCHLGLGSEREKSKQYGNYLLSLLC
jgi:hypothetical protein